MTDHPHSPLSLVQHDLAPPQSHEGAQHADVYCYNGQTEPVREFLRRAGSLAAVHVVSKPEQLRGHERFLFLHVKDHPQSIHEELWAMLADRRATVVEIDFSRVPGAPT